jgi:hypothetical protein
MESIGSSSSQGPWLFPTSIAVALSASCALGCRGDGTTAAAGRDLHPGPDTSVSNPALDAQDGDARAAALRSGDAGPAALDHVTAIFASRDRACAVESRRRVWCWDLRENMAELESCGVGDVARVAPGSASLGECLACETTVAGDAYCWTLASTRRFFRLPLPAGARAADVQTDTAYQMAGRLGRCSAAVQLTSGGLVLYEIDGQEGVDPDGGALSEVLLPVPAPVERIVMERSSICALLNDRRVWCSLYLDAMPTRIRTVGHAPPPGVIPELRGATDVRIAGMCVTGAFDHGRAREVCGAQVSEESGRATVEYRRTVRERAAGGSGATACAVSSEGVATCTPDRGDAAVVRRGTTVTREECAPGDATTP